MGLDGDFKLQNFDMLLKKGPSSRPVAKKILGLLLRSGKELSPFAKETLERLGIPFKNRNRLYHHLSLLEEGNFIERVRGGPIRLKFRTPLCFVADTPCIPLAYFGLLGAKTFEVSITETAVGLLKAEGKNPERIVVVTSQKAVGEWAGSISPFLKVEWLTMTEHDLNDPLRVEERVKPKVVELMKDYNLIMDCTSGPRPAGIAFYGLAQRLRVPLIYVYAPEKRLIWLIGRDRLREEVGGCFIMGESESVKCI
ncbi:MAG: winged helix-turn-helix domain-containing protein [Candidatus Bathycorpusculaceae bacterium]